VCRQRLRPRRRKTNREHTGNDWWSHLLAITPFQPPSMPFAVSLPTQGSQAACNTVFVGLSPQRLWVIQAFLEHFTDRNEAPVIIGSGRAAGSDPGSSQLPPGPPRLNDYVNCHQPPNNRAIRNSGEHQVLQIFKSPTLKQPVYHTWQDNCLFVGKGGDTHVGRAPSHRNSADSQPDALGANAPLVGQNWTELVQRIRADDIPKVIAELRNELIYINDVIDILERLDLIASKFAAGCATLAMSRKIREATESQGPRPQSQKKPPKLKPGGRQ
jgi:hypothetical protein